MAGRLRAIVHLGRGWGLLVIVGLLVEKLLGDSRIEHQLGRGLLLVLWLFEFHSTLLLQGQRCGLIFADHKGRLVLLRTLL